MQRIAVWFFAFFMVLGTGLDHAEAKRLGGGKTFGSFSKSTTKSTGSNSYTQPSKTNAATSTGARNSKMGFLGPLAGLAAGGLLASMFFGDGFEGFQMFDFILIALVVFIIFKLMARKRQVSPAGASSAGYQKEAFKQQERTFDTNLMGGGAQVEPQVPDWFNAEGFVERAKGHFVHLQQAWDSNDLAEIQDFVTPELYNLLSEERKAQAETPNTEVVNLEARLGGVSQQGSLAEASVVFSGQIRENSSVPTEFSETWHLVRDMRQENANWYLQGIQQN